MEFCKNDTFCHKLPRTPLIIHGFDSCLFLHLGNGRSGVSLLISLFNLVLKVENSLSTSLPERRDSQRSWERSENSLLRVFWVVLNSNFDRLSCFNRRLKYAELAMGKVISDIRNNVYVPTCKEFAELICENFVDKCCWIIVRLWLCHGSVGNQEIAEHN